MSCQNPISGKVMDRIKGEEICPRSRGWFTCLECFVYTFWLVSVLVGSVALAVLFYIVLHGWYSFYELTGMTRVGYVLSYLPLLWIATLIGTVGLAYKNFRQTRRGYRYPVWLVLIACIGMSFIGGAAFYWFGVGQLVDTHLGERMPTMYVSQAEYEAAFWSQPNDHRWQGQLTDTPTGWTLTDRTGAEWFVTFAHVPLAVQQIPYDGAMVQILGTSTEIGMVTACAVIHKPAGQMSTVAEKARDRQLLIEQLAANQMDSGPCHSVAQLTRPK
jgi:hypothetical protein